MAWSWLCILSTYGIILRSIWFSWNEICSIQMTSISALGIVWLKLVQIKSHLLCIGRVFVELTWRKLYCLTSLLHLSLIFVIQVKQLCHYWSSHTSLPSSCDISFGQWSRLNRANLKIITGDLDFLNDSGPFIGWAHTLVLANHCQPLIFLIFDLTAFWWHHADLFWLMRTSVVTELGTRALTSADLQL